MGDLRGPEPDLGARAGRVLDVREVRDAGAAVVGAQGQRREHAGERAGGAGERAGARVDDVGLPDAADLLREPQRRGVAIEVGDRVEARIGDGGIVVWV